MDLSVAAAQLSDGAQRDGQARAARKPTTRIIAGRWAGRRPLCIESLIDDAPSC